MSASSASARSVVKWSWRSPFSAARLRPGLDGGGDVADGPAQRVGIGEVVAVDVVGDADVAAEIEEARGVFDDRREPEEDGVIALVQGVELALGDERDFLVVIADERAGGRGERGLGEGVVDAAEALLAPAEFPLEEAVVDVGSAEDDFADEGLGEAGHGVGRAVAPMRVIGSRMGFLMEEERRNYREQGDNGKGVPGRDVSSRRMHLAFPSAT